MKIKVIVTLKNGVLDPQGKAIQQTLNGMGFESIKEVRQGKYFDIEVNENDRFLFITPGIRIEIKIIIMYSRAFLLSST